MSINPEERREPFCFIDNIAYWKEKRFLLTVFAVLLKKKEPLSAYYSSQKGALNFSQF